MEYFNGYKFSHRYYNIYRTYDDWDYPQTVIDLNSLVTPMEKEFCTQDANYKQFRIVMSDKKLKLVYFIKSGIYVEYLWEYLRSRHPKPAFLYYRDKKLIEGCYYRRGEIIDYFPEYKY